MSVSEDALIGLVALLKKRGWKPQDAGLSALNGTLGINLLKEGEMLTLLADSMPDEECLDELFGQGGNDA
ncbi:MAG: hypothetical protein DRP56_01625 [Planctomycetota bacterium]|nr:MAG: hypothetical protein DRP56_01625 [Planctomycetota bacterium]